MREIGRVYDSVAGVHLKSPGDYFSSQWQCPKCGFNSPRSHDECPKCGVIVEKLFVVDLKAALDDLTLCLKYRLTEDQLTEWKRKVATKGLVDWSTLSGRKVQSQPGDDQSDPQISSDQNTDQHPKPRLPFSLASILKHRSLLSLAVGIVVVGLFTVFMVNQQEAIKALNPPISGTNPEDTGAHKVPPPAPSPPVIVPKPDSYRAISTGKIIPVVETIAGNYRKTHTYSMEDLFVCVEMSIDVWNQLITKGIRAHLRAGNPEVDLKDYKRFSPEYYSRINHVWVMFQTEDGEYMPVETTQGHVVQNSHPHFERYLEGIDFENPKRLRSHMEVRTKMTEACKEAQEMSQSFNRIYVGTRKTEGSVLEKGKIDQKNKDCQKFIREFEASLR